MNYLDIAIRVGAQAAQNERDFRRHFHDSSMSAAETFEAGAKAMLAELRKTHAIVPRDHNKVNAFSADPAGNTPQTAWDAIIAMCEVKP